MEITLLCYRSYKMYNPSAGDVIIDGERHDEAKSLIACWQNDFFDEPIIKDETLKSAWSAFAAPYEVDVEEFNDYAAFDKFLEDYDNPAWKVYKITVSLR